MSGPVRRWAALLGAVALGLVALGSTAVPAAAQAVPEVEIVGTDVTEFPVVSLTMAVSGDAAAAALEADDLEVTENGEPVAVEVIPLSEESLDVVLAIDVSGSMAGDPLAQAKVAALRFIDELPGDARVAIVAFGNAAQLRSGSTTDRDATRNTVNALTEGGETSLYDAVILASQQVNASDASRTAVVVLSDGADTVSNADLDAAVGAVQGTETDFFAVSLQTGEADEAALASLADAAGGTVVPAADPEALTAAYVDLGQRIANQYELVFESVTEDPIATFAVTVEDTGDSASIQLALPGRSGGTATTEVAQPVTVEPLITEGTADTVEQDWVLWLGVALVAIALAVTGYVVAASGSGRAPRRSLRSDRAPVYDAGTGERIVTSVREAATRFTSRAVERSEQERTIDHALDRAGLVMRAGEFVALVLAVALAAGFLLYLLMGPAGLAIGLLGPMVGAPTALRLLAARRNAKFADQLSDTLLLLAGSLRSGFGVGQAIDQVAEEMDPPMGTEFGRAILETRLGRDPEDALAGIAGRVQNEDFEWVIDAMRIHRQVGGDLAQILDKVSETIRARNRLRRQIRALTAEGRMSAIVLGILPVAMGLVLYSSNPDYLEPLFTETGGRIMLGGGVGLLALGAYWLKRLIDVEL